MTIPDYYVRVLALPPAVKGLAVTNDDGTFSIYINAIYDALTQRRALEHELEHLARDHFYSPEPLAAQERAARGEVRPGTRPPERTVRLYPDLRSLERYLRSVGALDRPIEALGRPL